MEIYKADYCTIAVWVLLLVVGGCASNLSEAEQLRRNKPTLIADIEGVKVWRVKDETLDAQRKYVYFTTPNGEILDQRHIHR
jgi:hypothetical protein